MGILCPIVQAFVGAVFDTGHDLSLCCAIRPKLVGDHHSRCPALALQQLTHQSFGGVGIAAALDQNLQNEAVLIDGTPQPVLLATDRDNGLIEMPFVAKPTGRAAANVVRKMSAEFRCPKPDRLMRHCNPASRKEVLDHPQAQRKSEIQPRSVRDYLCGETMAAIERITFGPKPWSHI